MNTSSLAHHIFQVTCRFVPVFVDCDVQSVSLPLPLRPGWSSPDPLLKLVDSSWQKQQQQQEARATSAKHHGCPATRVSPAETESLRNMLGGREAEVVVLREEARKEREELMSRLLKDKERYICKQHVVRRTIRTTSDPSGVGP